MHLNPVYLLLVRRRSLFIFLINRRVPWGFLIKQETDVSREGEGHRISHSMMQMSGVCVPSINESMTLLP
jgi:hypothetical protein